MMPIRRGPSEAPLPDLWDFFWGDLDEYCRIHRMELFRNICSVCKKNPRETVMGAVTSLLAILSVGIACFDRGLFWFQPVQTANRFGFAAQYMLLGSWAALPPIFFFFYILGTYGDLPVPFTDDQKDEMARSKQNLDNARNIWLSVVVVLGAIYKVA